MSTSTVSLNEKSGYRIMGMSIQLFAIITSVVLIATYMEVLPKGMIGAFALMMVIGAIFNEIGSRLPIVKDYLGGGPIVIIFGSAALVTYGILPEYSSAIMSNFMRGEGFLDFYIAALITGSILGMNRKLLIKASIRYLPAIIGGVVVSLGLVGLVGAVIGYGATEAILYIGVPIMGGGMGAGAVPLSQIFGTSLGADPADILSIMIPAVALGNAIAIVAAGLLDRLGKIKPQLTGNGELMEIKNKEDEKKEEQQEEKVELNLTMLGKGLLLAVTFFSFGTTIGKFFPAVHSYAWMIIAVAVVKALNILPREYEAAAFQWFQFVMTNLTGVLLVGIGVAFTNLQQIIDAFTIQYLILVAVTIVGAVIGSGIVGKLVGFYPIESSITAGLCMANMGGTGDVAVLSASDRMKLMPFAQISSRIGGAFMLILASALLGIFL
ncbi:2-hydroxycarboxylate transporter family protein [Serpentinicella alkaliphila]|uniref:CCS family citrate carrier protein n=1 Tax=Serpentinicella alkaliphila TaxID=1734049 RepID=A0A4R2TNA5_9FIRM|nr:2-hydroxycarboxylate transporter family protein [Serpentinicella alkaliphila]QUH27072.1 2-hydroxycarboxylate transporter family protein [Serpentinicella alkaliphila]TCQ05198.1 CCS family citrate carrier protein [Serpentinicella alkaliphila]